MAEVVGGILVAGGARSERVRLALVMGRPAVG